MSETKHTQLIKQEAGRLGFDYTGISKAVFLENEAPHLTAYLNKNMHGEMDYLTKNFEKRLDPRKLVDGAKSVVSMLLNYYSPEKQNATEAPLISKYAFGKDYHTVISDKLKKLMSFIRKNIGEVNGRGTFVDSAPVLEKAWAVRGGLGWIGKNSLLINPQGGTYFFAAELVIDLPLKYDQPIENRCGDCTLCMDACPVKAIEKPYIMNACKCISYFNISMKGEIPAEMKGKMAHYAYGCDICQEVCPWNQLAKPTNEPAFKPNSNMLNMSKSEWKALCREDFNQLFKDSAIKEIGFEKLKRNIEFLDL